MTAQATETRITCTICGQTKPASEFYKNHSASGYYSWCKSCEIARSTARHREGSYKVNETRSFGIEIECLVPDLDMEQVARKLRAAGLEAYREGYGHTDRPYWKVTSDCSIERRSLSYRYNPMEVVSPALTGKAGVAELKKVLRVMRALGTKFNTSCSVHTHHDAAGLDLVGWKTLCKLYVHFEDAVDTVIQPSRRRSECKWAQGLKHESYSSTSHWGDVTEQSVFTKIDRCNYVEDMRDLWDRDRYVKLNLQAYWRHGTFEFRQHGGTADFDKLVNWIAFTQSMVEAASRHVTVTTRSQATLAKLMTTIGARRNVRTFLSRRAAAFAAA